MKTSSEMTQKTKWVFRTQSFRKNGFDIIQAVVLSEPDYSSHLYVAQYEKDKNFFGCTPFMVHKTNVFDTKEEAFNAAEKFFAQGADYLAALRRGYRVFDDDNPIIYQFGDRLFVK